MGAFMIIVAIFIGIIIIGGILSDEPVQKPMPKKKKRRRHYSSSHPPKTLPWFDKDYLKRKRKDNDIYI